MNERRTTMQGHHHHRGRRIVAAGFCALSILLSTQSAIGAALLAPNVRDSAPSARALDDLGQVPLSFELNAGQAGAQVKFLARGSGYAVLLTDAAALMSLQPVDDRSSLLRMALVNRRAEATLVGEDPLPGVANYFVGNDPRHWRSELPTYGKVRQREVYPGIDLVYYGKQRRLEYDFVLAPGADPRAIAFTLAGDGSSAPARRIDANGDLLIALQGGEVRFEHPVVYQADADGRHLVDGRFVLKDGDQIGFEVAAYDRSRPLVIDPVLSYATYLGGVGIDFGEGIAVDAAGAVYVTGRTRSFANFPTTIALSPHFGGSDETSAQHFDAFVTKYDGTGVVYSSYLGGASTEFGSDDYGRAIAVDHLGQAHVTGQTYSDNFPITTNAFQTENPITAAFVTKLNASGTALLYSSYLGRGTLGSIAGNTITVDAAGNTYVAGGTGKGSFPTTPGAYLSNVGRGPAYVDAFVSKLDTTQVGAASLVYSTLLGGAAVDQSRGAVAAGIAVDASGHIYVVGNVAVGDFPVTASAFQSALSGMQDAFVTVLDPGQTGVAGILYSSYLGGSDGATTVMDTAHAIAVREPSEVYITGGTSSLDFPTVNALQSSCGCILSGSPQGSPTSDAFISKFDTTKSGPESLTWSTYLGGDWPTPDSNQTYTAGHEIALDAKGNVYVAGLADTRNFPTKNAFDATAPTVDGFIARIKPDGSALLYSTFLGGGGMDWVEGLAVDAAGNAYVTGVTLSSDFPTLNAAYGNHGGTYDAFIAKIALAPDFSFDAIPDVFANVGGLATAQVRVNSVDDFSASVSLSASKAEFGPTFSPVSITPAENGSVSSTLGLKLGPSVVPGTYTFDVNGSAGTLSHAVPVTVRVSATSGGTTKVIGALEATGCIDSSGIAGALVNKLRAAQADIDAGRIQTAVNTLTALLHQLKAQAGKHITTSCTVDGVTFDPVAVLTTNVKALLAGLGVNLKANPIMGSVLNNSKAGVAGASVSIVNSAKRVIATTTTDVSGFYYFPAVGGLVTGGNYTVRSSPPAGYKGSTPGSQSFAWKGATILLKNFVMN